MLSKQDQIRYLTRELAAVKKFLTRVKSAKPGKKEIHGIRINIKKIIALNEINKIRGYDAGSLPMLGMKSLFRSAGIIRSSQIMLDGLEKSGIEEKKIGEYHHEIIRNTTKKLVSEASVHLKMLNEFRLEMNTKKLRNISNDQVLLYHHLKLEHLKKIFKIPLDPGTLHEGRKQIKHILYIQELISPALKKKIPIHFKNLDELQSLIGKWHDSTVYLECLQDFKVDKNQKVMKDLTSKMKDQLEYINLFRLDKNKEIFTS